MELNFTDEECCSFTISSKANAQSSQQITKNIMTDPIPYKDKNVETREEMKEFSVQCDFEPVNADEGEINTPELLGFLKSRLPLFDNTFRE
jgi:hypothetical protein